MKITIEAKGLDALRLQIAGLGRKIKTAQVAALNSAAFVGAKETSEAVAKTFDRPTPWVKGSVRYKKATKDRVEVQIDFDKWGNKTGVTVEKVLQAQIHGGQRKLKRHEIALQRAGILPPGMAIAPGPAAKKDAYGNMSAAQIVQIISWFKAAGEQGYSANMRDGGKRLGRDNKKTGAKGFAYFALRTPYGKLQPGIYQRFTFGFGSAVKPVMYFIKPPTYKKRLDFYGIAEKAARKEFDRAFAMYAKQFLSERGL